LYSAQQRNAPADPIYPHRISSRFVKTSKGKTDKKEGNPTNFLQPRIDLLNNIPARPSRPLATSLRDSRRQLDLLNLIRVRDRVDVQAAGHVPGYVAVESWD
jgi:hypothetical protein